MGKKIKLISLILQGLVLLQSIQGQERVFSPDYISRSFQDYCKSVPREEIFIHTDRDEYIAGEELWFNIYLIDRQSLKPSLNSKIVYFEILSPGNRPIVQKRILLENGFGPGQTFLPDTLSSGTYTIRAYTSWMKNFSPVNCFIKDIRVYNPLKSRTFIASIKSFDRGSTSPGKWNNNSLINLHVNNLRKDSLEILITADEKFRSENRNLLILFIQTRGTINYLNTCNIADNVTKITIPKNALTTGINQITFFDKNGPVIERYIYTPGKEKQVPTSFSIDSCKKRDKVTLETGSDPSGNIDLTNLSISVAVKADKPVPVNMNEYLILGTEFGIFPGNLINERKFTDLSANLMDSLLQTLKSNWIDWTTIFSNEKQVLKYPFEKEEYSISGKMLADNLQPVNEDEVILMSAPGKEAVFQYTKTDRDGKFNFMIPFGYGMNELIIQPDSENLKIFIESSFSDKYIPCEIVVDSSGKLPTSVLRQSIINQVRKIYGSSPSGDCLTPALPSLKPKRFYGKPDLELIMKDYIQLDSIPEVFFELIPHVTLTKVNSIYEIARTDASHKRLEGVPCVMLDGVIIKDLSVIALLAPDIVEKIDVIREDYRVGNYLFNGIVNIITKPGDFAYGSLPDNAMRMQLRIFSPVCSFLSPDYSSSETRNSPEPDYRNTLYWNPSFKPDKNGEAKIEFWTSDVNGDYLINLSGFSADGEIISLNKTFKVK